MHSSWQQQQEFGQINNRVVSAIKLTATAMQSSLTTRVMQSSRQHQQYLNQVDNNIEAMKLAQTTAGQ